MIFQDLIAKKRDGGEYSEKDIRLLIEQVIDPEVPDYQMGALLMAIYLNGMSEEETIFLTKAMAESGEMINLTHIAGMKVVDKHSTGGVGDKTSLVLVPLIASMGVPVSKLSGRGLGHTGGTIDKLEVFEGLKTNLSIPEFVKQIEDIGLVIAGQTNNLVPADKILYKFRDLTGTVGSLPLIASSIMSKKIAGGADKILLDVKVGQGATFGKLDQARALAKMMIRIGTTLGVETRAVLTDMEIPLGRAIGNSMEVREAIETLMGKGPDDVKELCLHLGAHMIELVGSTRKRDEIYQVLQAKLSDGSALNKLIQMIEYQGGNNDLLKHLDKFESAEESKTLVADKEGFLQQMNAKTIGIASMTTGAGREHKEDKLDLRAGIFLNKIVGEFVKKGDVLLTLYATDKAKLEKAYALVADACMIGDRPPSERKLIIEELQ